MMPDVPHSVAVGSKSNPIIIALNEFEGQQLLDIRRYYLDKKTKELKPTKKGISLPFAAATQVLDVLQASRDKVFAWLQAAPGGYAEAAAAAMAARTAARDQEARSAKHFEVKSHSTKETAFFSVSQHGASDVIRLNASHPVYNALTTCNDTKAPEVLQRILAAYSRAKGLFADHIDADADTFFAIFEHEWGLILRNYCND